MTNLPGYLSFFQEKSFIGCPVQNRTTKCDFISKFKFITYGNTPGKGCDCQWEILQFAVKIEVGSITFNSSWKRQDNFIYLSFSDTGDQVLDGQIFRPNPFHWRNDPPKNMINTAHLPGIFNGHHV